MQITKQDAMMFAIYLIAIGVGAMMAERQPIFGIIQVTLGAVFFGLRLWSVTRP